MTALPRLPIPTPTRRSILSQTARLAGAAVLGYATVEPAQALAVFSQMAPANENEHADLAEARRLVAALNAADDKISAASDAHDADAEEAAEAERSELGSQLSRLERQVSQEPTEDPARPGRACRDCRLYVLCGGGRATAGRRCVRASTRSYGDDRASRGRRLGRPLAC